MGMLVYMLEISKKAGLVWGLMGIIFKFWHNLDVVFLILNTHGKGINCLFR